ncbi:MAG: BlaI/MecI/CopY family transcriptional regulator [Candidatus Aminicenantaceae bacterium]
MPQKKLSPGNLEIMKIVWEKKEVTINDVLKAINEKRSDKIRRTTVQVQMRRLEEYGWLTHRTEGRTFHYSAVKEKQNTRKEILKDIINRVFSGSRTELVKCLMDDRDLKPEEIIELRNILKESKRN